MAIAGKRGMEHPKTGRGHRQRVDFLDPGAVRIVRRPMIMCRAPINTDGVGRAIKSHLLFPYSEIQQPVAAAVLKFNQPEPVRYFYPTPTRRVKRGGGGGFRQEKGA